MENNFNQYLINYLKTKNSDFNKLELEELKNLYFKEGHINCDLKVGDKVKFTKDWFCGENGTSVIFHDNFRHFIGDTTTILSKSSTGYLLDFNFYVPYFVLEKVKEEFVPLDYNDELVGKVVVSKTSKNKRLIVFQSENTVFTGGNNLSVSYQTLMDGFTFQDGTACHKLKQ